MKRSTTKAKELGLLRPEDLEQHRVWRVAYRDSEPVVTPVARVPVARAGGQLFSTNFVLACGATFPGFVGTLEESLPHLNRHLATFSFYTPGRWFHLARYHDPDYQDRGPDALAAFLGHSVEEVFPFTFDIRGLIRTPGLELSWPIERSPEKRIARRELIAAVVSGEAELLRREESGE